MAQIRLMTEKDRESVISMMRAFYASPAVFTNGSEEIFRNNVNACISSNPYLEGYVFAEGDTIQGYAILAKSYATEFGAPCIWIEDLYLKSEYRGQGMGGRFLQFVAESYPDAVLRLEVEEENAHAIHVYKKAGFTILPYVELKKDGLH